MHGQLDVQGAKTNPSRILAASAGEARMVKTKKREF
jgi:hypothetical protein